MGKKPSTWSSRCQATPLITIDHVSRGGGRGLFFPGHVLLAVGWGTAVLGQFLQAALVVAALARDALLPVGLAPTPGPVQVAGGVLLAQQNVLELRRGQQTCADTAWKSGVGQKEVEISCGSSSKMVYHAVD